MNAREAIKKLIMEEMVSSIDLMTDEEFTEFVHFLKEVFEEKKGN